MRVRIFASRIEIASGGCFMAAVVMMLSLISSCQQVTRQMIYGDVIATVNSASLTREEVSSAMPSYLHGADSLDFADRYVERWLKRQVKVEEAKRIFPASLHEVEMMVEAYRQALLTQKLDQYYINTAGELAIEDIQVRRYYNQNNDKFRLDRNIVKGRILRLPLNYADASKLKGLMASNTEDSRLDLISIIEKSGMLEFEEFTDQWIDYNEFLGKLPIVRDSKSGVYMRRDGVQTLQDSEWSYLFVITAYRSAGYVAPLERVDGLIRQVLTHDLQMEMLREREDELYRKAQSQGVIKQRRVDL